jgi:hypothetical protein
MPNAHTGPSREVQQCIKDCSDCAAICAQCAYHCLHMGGEHAGPEHQGVVLDCKQICALAVGFMARESRHMGHVCRECAEICIACAESCERLGQGDDMMRRCAEVCRRCAASCEKMAGAGV